MKTVPTSQHSYNAAITAADMMLKISRQMNMIIALPLPSHPPTCLYHNQYLFSSCIFFFMSYKFVCLMPCGRGFNSPPGIFKPSMFLYNKVSGEAEGRHICEGDGRKGAKELQYAPFLSCLYILLTPNVTCSIRGRY